MNEASNKMGIVLPDIPGFSLTSTVDAGIYKASILNGLDPFLRVNVNAQQIGKRR